MLDEKKRVLYHKCRPTDDLGSSIFASGFATRIGQESTPSVALLDRHVRKIDADLTSRFWAARTRAARRELSKAGLLNTLLWLAWLRSMEAFSLKWADVQVIEPADGPSVDLPKGIGAVLLQLLPETKSSRTKKADVVCAYKTMSGYTLGRWISRARCYSKASDSELLFCHPNGRAWDSLYFRETYLYPGLRSQQAAGDPLLKAFDALTGPNSIAAKFWSLHCDRRGARTQSTRGGHVGGYYFSKATKDQVYEHARWERKRSGEQVDVIYREWTIRDRIKITLYCQ